MRNLVLVIGFAVSLFSVSSCERKVLVDSSIYESTAVLPVSIDWESSGITGPQNVSVLIYNKFTDSLVYEYRYAHNGNTVQSYVYLPLGTYRAVVFNEIRGGTGIYQVDYTSLSGYNDYSALTFYADKTNSYYVRGDASTANYLNQPGDVAVHVVPELIVNEELISYTRGATRSGAVSTDTRVTSEALMNLVPVRKSSILHITIHVDGLQYAAMPALVELQNISNGYMPSTDCNTMESSRMQFTINNRVYDDAMNESGTISTTASLFGVLGERTSTAEYDEDMKLNMVLYFTLINSKIHQIEMDLTPHIKFDAQAANIYLDLTLEEKLPEAFGAGGEYGTGVTVGDWNVVDVTLKF